MTTDHANSGGDPQDLLSGSRVLARRVRAAQRATWYPLLVLAAVTFVAILVYRFGGYAHTCTSVRAPGAEGRVCSVYSTAAFVYWPIALVLAYGSIAVFYVRRAAARGVGTRVTPYVVAGVVLALVLTAAALWAAHHPPKPSADFLGLHVQRESFDVLNRVAGPACAIGLGLLVLARVERSVALFAVTVGYLVVVLVPVTFGWTVTHVSVWFFLPRIVIDGGFLLLAAAGFALAQRPIRAPAG